MVVLVLLFVRQTSFHTAMSPRGPSFSQGKGESFRGATNRRLGAHLDHEDPDTRSHDVAKVWAIAYTELVDFEETLLNQVTERLESLSEGARHEAELTNVPMMVDHLQTFKYRKAFWRQRLSELNGEDGS